MAWGVPQAPRWAWASMTAGAIALVVLGYLAMNRPEPPGPTAPVSAAEPTAAGPSRVLVVGDSYTGGSDEGGQGANGWAAIVDSKLNNVTIETAAAGGSGYVETGPTGQTFPQLVAAAAGGYDLVVFFGSRNDTAEAAEVQTAAEQAFATARQESPDAGLLVIGPPWVDANPPDYILSDRDAVAAATAAAGATFVDPLSEGWFADRPELIGSDGVHPTDDGHQYIADLIQPLLERALS